MPETDLRTQKSRPHSAADWWIGKTYFSPAAGGEITCLLSGTLVYPSTSSSRLCKQQPILKAPNGLITHYYKHRLWTYQAPKTTSTFQHLIWEKQLYSNGSGRHSSLQSSRVEDQK